MPAPSIRHAADPLDDIDRDNGGADTVMARRDRADLPGARADRPPPGQGEIYTDAARELSRESVAPRQEALDADREAQRVADGEADIELAGEGLGTDVAHGPDDDDTIDETERAGDDSIR
ncbi:MAG: hypothetical protein JF586_10165 [Burkholderiales bacterium]|jgi:hypothetical protein|nr:hypothetical protein [Burkholderiales bacterium]